MKPDNASWSKAMEMHWTAPLWAAVFFISAAVMAITLIVRLIKPDAHAAFDWVGSCFLTLAGMGLTWLDGLIVGFTCLVVGILWLLAAFRASFILRDQRAGVSPTVL